MTLLEHISKEVGWKHKQCKVPSLPKAEALYIRVIIEGRTDAFKLVMFYFRFMRRHELTVKQVRAANAIDMAYAIGAVKFSQDHTKFLFA